MSGMVHAASVCEGQPCPYHHPSDHLMVTWPTLMRTNRLVERVCRHGVGHPDPDSLDYFARSDPGNGQALGVHGCDGCCLPRRVPVDGVGVSA